MELILPDKQRALELPGTLDSDESAEYLADTIVAQGQTPDGETITWDEFSSLLSPKFADEITTSEIQPLLAKTFDVLIREPVEPRMVINSLYTPVRAQGMTHQVVAGATGAFVARDVQEGGTYPEVNFQVGGATSTAWIGKSGIAAAFTDEALRYTTWDIMGRNLRQMRAALVRHKELKAVTHLRALGTVLYDNISPASSRFGVTTGRGPDMNANGTMRMEDILKGYAHMSEEGFPPDTLLLHPLMYTMWVQDPVVRQMAINHGGGSMFQPWSGEAGPRAPWPTGPQGATGPTTGRAVTPGGNASGAQATPTSQRSQQATSTPALPGYFPWPFRILTSPLVPFDADDEIGDIFLLRSGDIGLHLKDEDTTEVSWRDEGREITKVKLRERYGYAVLHEGLPVGVCKNIKVGHNWFSGVIQATTMEVNSEISATADIDL